MDLSRTRFILCLALMALFVGTATPTYAKISSGFTSAEPLNGEVGTGAMVKVRTIFVPPGFDSNAPPGIKLPISLLNDSGLPVGGLQFDLDFTWLLYSEVYEVVIDPVLDALGYELQAEPQPNGNLRVIIYNIPPQGEGISFIPAGNLDVAWICFRTEHLGEVPPPIPPLGETDPIHVVPGSVHVSDEHGFLLGSAWMDGAIQIGIKCDTNRDGLVTVQDIVVWVGSWLELAGYVPFPTDPEDVLFKIFDGNMDGTSSVADAIGIVNKILGRPMPPLVKVVGGAPIIVDLGAPALQLDGQLAIPVMLDAGSVIAGGEMSFSFDPEVMAVGEPYLDNTTSDLILQSKVEDGVVRLMVISLSKDKGLATGNKPTLMIPITLRDDREGMLTLDAVILVNQLAQELPVRLGDHTQAINKAMLAPTSFALRDNAPNPFNPTTTISYEVPQPAHIQLVIYNILGQEVIKLVDEVKTPGRYTAVWDARNAQGRAVSSGIYMYRLSSSTGFSDAKRMTLLK